MFKVLKPIKDAYITDRVTNGQAQTGANTGIAGSLDLFKIYGLTYSGSTANTELSRILIQFDLDPLRDLISAGKVDFTNPSFSCHLQMSDVYGGQPCPANFQVGVHPLAHSFDEGRGKDVVLYQDYDVCNWLTASQAFGTWVQPGCNSAGQVNQGCDYFTSYLDGSCTRVLQTFVDGTEDLDVDITTMVSATLAGIISDNGFRVAFARAEIEESNNNTYFVKRFASRHAYNNDLAPRLVVTFDDSIQDDTDNVYLDSPATIFFYNYVQSSLANLMSGSSPVTGSNCMYLTLSTAVSGGLYGLVFNASQHHAGTNEVTGIYSASVTVPSNDALLAPQLAASGSITFTPIWTSRDGTVTYLTGEPFKALPPQRGGHSMVPRKFAVTVLGVPASLGPDEQTVFRVNIFDYTRSYVSTVTRLPVDLPGIVVRDVYYQVRDKVTGRVVVPFDTVQHSTRLSNDVDGMYFTLDTSNLTYGHTYVIDILILNNGNQQLYREASTAFRVGDTT